MNTAPARLLSFLLAMALAAVVTFYPPALGHFGHGMLTLVVWGICAGFVHGFGFVPDGRLWRLAVSPWLAWLLMGWALVRLG